MKLLPQGEALTVSIVEVKDLLKPGSQPLGGLTSDSVRCTNVRVLAEIQEKLKLQPGHQPPNDAKLLKLEAELEPPPGVLGVMLTIRESKLPAELAAIVYSLTPLHCSLLTRTVCKGCG